MNRSRAPNGKAALSHAAIPKPTVGRNFHTSGYSQVSTEHLLRFRAWLRKHVKFYETQFWNLSGTLARVDDELLRRGSG